MEIAVEGPRPFKPAEKTEPGSEQTKPEPGKTEEDPWRTWWTDKRGMEAIALARSTAARVMDDQSLKADAATLEFAGPPLAACIRALPVGSVGGFQFSDPRVALAGLVLILALAVALPILLAMRARRRRRQREGTQATVEQQPEEIAQRPSSRYPVPGQSRMVGSGQID